ncbi:hypothetical protein HYH03_003315 [Edaphochlamys debaryana]|uniref:Uncharacterized protein n=1 Tax=Edaphochlamys debaryana TaxID=47281 RepID=A0A836C4B0_9CHLO|nr:hypothetical protein HYH03_003315 [Edaphochlamys debaryana]|eukprot:KAG2498564.1 hypothetical protein HYH03_003315 [Edaphochlamys debaryana]
MEYESWLGAVSNAEDVLRRARIDHGNRMAFMASNNQALDGVAAGRCKRTSLIRVQFGAGDPKDGRGQYDTDSELFHRMEAAAAEAEAAARHASGSLGVRSSSGGGWAAGAAAAAAATGSTGDAPGTAGGGGCISTIAGVTINHALLAAQDNDACYGGPGSGMGAGVKGAFSPVARLSLGGSAPRRSSRAKSVGCNAVVGEEGASGAASDAERSPPGRDSVGDGASTQGPAPASHRSLSASQQSDWDAALERRVGRPSPSLPSARGRKRSGSGAAHGSFSASGLPPGYRSANVSHISAAYGSDACTEDAAAAADEEGVTEEEAAWLGALAAQYGAPSPRAPSVPTVPKLAANVAAAQRASVPGSSAPLPTVTAAWMLDSSEAGGAAGAWEVPEGGMDPASFEAAAEAALRAPRGSALATLLTAGAVTPRRRQPPPPSARGSAPGSAPPTPHSAQPLRSSLRSLSGEPPIQAPQGTGLGLGPGLSANANAVIAAASEPTPRAGSALTPSRRAAASRPHSMSSSLAPGSPRGSFGQGLSAFAPSQTAASRPPGSVTAAAAAAILGSASVQAKAAAPAAAAAPADVAARARATTARPSPSSPGAPLAAWGSTPPPASAAAAPGGATPGPRPPRPSVPPLLLPAQSASPSTSAVASPVGAAAAATAAAAAAAGSGTAPTAGSWRPSVPKSPRNSVGAAMLATAVAVATAAQMPPSASGGGAANAPPHRPVASALRRSIDLSSAPFGAGALSPRTSAGPGGSRPPTTSAFLSPRHVPLLRPGGGGCGGGARSVASSEPAARASPLTSLSGAPQLGGGGGSRAAAEASGGAADDGLRRPASPTEAAQAQASAQHGSVGAQSASCPLRGPEPPWYASALLPGVALPAAAAFGGTPAAAQPLPPSQRSAQPPSPHAALPASTGPTAAGGPPAGGPPTAGRVTRALSGSGCRSASAQTAGQSVPEAPRSCDSAGRAVEGGLVPPSMTRLAGVSPAGPMATAASNSGWALVPTAAAPAMPSPRGNNGNGRQRFAQVASGEAAAGGDAGSGSVASGLGAVERLDMDPAGALASPSPREGGDSLVARVRRAFGSFRRQG